MSSPNPIDAYLASLGNQDTPPPPSGGIPVGIDDYIKRQMQGGAPQTINVDQPKTLTGTAGGRIGSAGGAVGRGQAAPNPVTLPTYPDTGIATRDTSKYTTQDWKRLLADPRYKSVTGTPTDEERTAALESLPRGAFSPVYPTTLEQEAKQQTTPIANAGARIQAANPTMDKGFANLLGVPAAMLENVGGEINKAVSGKTTGKELTAAPIGQTLRYSPLGLAEWGAEVLSPDAAKYLQTTPTRDAPVVGAIARAGEALIGAVSAGGEVIAKPAAGIAQIGLQQAFKELTGQSTPQLDDAYDKLIKASESDNPLANIERIGRGKFEQEARRAPETAAIQFLFDPTTYFDVFKLAPSLRGLQEAQRTLQATADVANVGKAVENLPPLERAVLSVLKPTTIKEGAKVSDAMLGLANTASRVSETNPVRRLVTPFTQSPASKLNNVLTRVGDNISLRLSDSAMSVADKFKWIDLLKDASKNETLMDDALKQFMGERGIVDSLDNRRTVRAALDFNYAYAKRDYDTAVEQIARLESGMQATRPFVPEVADEVAKVGEKLGDGYRNAFQSSIEDWKAGKMDLSQLREQVDTIAGYRLTNDFIEHAANTLSKASGVSKPNWITRQVGKMRAYEGLMYLTSNMGALTNNIVGDVGRLVMHGVEPRDLAAFYKRIGYRPPENMGQILKQAIEGAAKKEAHSAYGSQLPNWANNIPGLKQVTGAFEKSQQYGRELAFANSYERFLNANHRYGAGLPRMPKALEDYYLATEGQKGLRRRVAELEAARNFKEGENALFGQRRTWSSYRDDIAAQWSRDYSKAAGRDIQIKPEMVQDALAIQDKERMRELFDRWSMTDQTPAEYQRLRREMFGTNTEGIANAQMEQRISDLNAQEQELGDELLRLQGKKTKIAKERRKEIGTMLDAVDNERTAIQEELGYTDLEILFGKNPGAPTPPKGAKVLTPEIKWLTEEDIARQTAEFKASQTSSVPFSITRDTRQQLYDLKYSRADVDKMTPQEAQAIVASGRTNAVQTPPTTPSDVSDAVPTPLDDNPLPPADLPAAQLTDGQESARQYLLSLTRADGSPIYTAEQLATWKPDTLERIAGELQLARATFDDVMRAAKDAGVATATEKGAPNNKYLLNVLNKHRAEGAERFASIADVRERADEARGILQGYNQEERIAKNGRLQSGDLPTSPDVALGGTTGDVGEVQQATSPVTDRIQQVYEEAKQAGATSAVDPKISKAWNDANLQAALDAIERAITEEAQQAAGVMNPQLEAAGRDYLNRQYMPALNTAKAGANAAGRWGIDSTVLNYDNRYNIDDTLNFAAPFTYWWLHSMLNFTKDFIEHPALLAYYVRLREMMDKQSEGMPDKYKHKVQMPFPMSEKLGTLWGDPTRGFMPVADVFMLSAMERAGYQGLKEDGSVDYDGAFSDMFGIHQAYKIPFWLMQGNTDELKNVVASLPAARAIRGLTAPFKPGGVGIEGKYDVFYYERAAKELVADGTLTDEQAKIGILQQGNNPYWLQIKQRAGLENYTVREMSGMLGLRSYAFTAGEQKFLEAQKAQENVLQNAVKRLGGNPNMPTDARYQFLSDKGYFKTEEYQNFKRQYPELATGSFIGKAYPQGENESDVDPAEVTAAITFLQSSQDPNAQTIAEALRTGRDTGEALKLAQQSLQTYGDALRQTDLAQANTGQGDIGAAAQALEGFSQVVRTLEAMGESKPSMRLPDDETQMARERDYYLGKIAETYYSVPELRQKMIAADLGEEFKRLFLDKQTKNLDAIPRSTYLGWANALDELLAQPTAGTVPTQPDPFHVTFTTDDQNKRYQEFYDSVEQSIGHNNLYNLEQRYFGLDKAGRAAMLKQNPKLKIAWDAEAKFYEDNPDLLKLMESKGLKKASSTASTTDPKGAALNQAVLAAGLNWDSINAMKAEYNALPKGTGARTKYLAAKPDLLRYFQISGAIYNTDEELSKYSGSGNSGYTRTIYRNTRTPQAARPNSFNTKTPKVHINYDTLVGLSSYYNKGGNGQGGQNNYSRRIPVVNQ